MKGINSYLLLVLIIALSSNQILRAQKGLHRIINLEGTWNFSIGTNVYWNSKNYDDSQWEKMHVPSSWEDQGFHDYNGYAYYRKKVTISDEFKGQMLYLIPGYIDDVDAVYFNGELIGSTGTFPPSYQTAYNAYRKYYIPEELIDFNGINIIAVKVYDAEQAGGIVSGEVGIYTTNYGISLDVNLQGNWKFKLGDNFEWKREDYNDTNWNEIFVPSRWEDQGYKRYNGYAWYRKSFKYNGRISPDNMVVIMGKIDDADQVYVNGVLVGSTGNMPKVENKKFHTHTEWLAFRGYYFPAKLLKANEPNIIAVRVYDNGGEGGIYEGPVGIVSQTKYIEFWRRKKRANW